MNEPRCVACGCGRTVEHILIECGVLTDIRQIHYDAETLRQLFHEINITEVFDFV